jgi:hypothetical protein
MSGHKPFKTLSDRLRSSPEGRAQIENERALTNAIVELTKLRQGRGATQSQIAAAWKVTQANISKVEHTPDIFLSTLSRYVEALGGHLEVRAVFPDEVVCLLPAEGSSEPDSDPPEAEIAG